MHGRRVIPVTGIHDKRSGYRLSSSWLYLFVYTAKRAIPVRGISLESGEVSFLGRRDESFPISITQHSFIAGMARTYLTGYYFLKYACFIRFCWEIISVSGIKFAHINSSQRPARLRLTGSYKTWILKYNDACMSPCLLNVIVCIWILNLKTDSFRY